MARNEGEGGQKDTKGCGQEKSGKCFEHSSVPICIAWLSDMHETTSSSGLLTRKQWLFKIPAVKGMEEPASLYIFQWSLSQNMMFLENSDTCENFQDLLEKYKQWGSQFAIIPNPVSLSSSSSMCCIYKGCLPCHFCPSRLQLSQNPRDMSLSSVIILALQPASPHHKPPSWFANMVFRIGNVALVSLLNQREREKQAIIHKCFGLDTEY